MGHLLRSKDVLECIYNMEEGGHLDSAFGIY